MRFFFIALISIFFASHTKAQVVDPLWDRIKLTGIEAKVFEAEPEKVKKEFPLWIPLAGGAVGGAILLLTSGKDGGGTEPPELPPVTAVNDRLEIPCDGSGTVNVLSNDVGEGLQIQSFSNTTGIDLQHDGTGLVTISNPGSGTFSVSYSLRDQHDQVATAVITIIGLDDEAPQLDCPDDVIIDCGDPMEPSFTGQPGIKDNCDPAPQIEFTDEETTGACPFVKSILRTFTVSDASGNSSNCTHTILVKDDEPPVVQQEAQDLVLDCSAVDNDSLASEWLDSHGGAQIMDACGSELTWSHSLEEIPAEVGSVEVTFTVTDSCGNSTVLAAQLIIEDLSPPVLQQEAMDLIIECGSDIDASILDWLDKNGGAQAEDACGSLTWSNDFAGSIATCDPTSPTQVTFTATDEAGNSISTTAGVSISDTEAPTFVCPPDFTLDFGQEPVPAITGLPTELRDDCSDEIRAFFEDEVVLQTDGSLILRTWTVLDFCGNANTCVQQIKVPGQNCDFPLSFNITQPSSPSASDGIIVVTIPPEAPPPPYTLIVNGETTTNIPGRQVNLAGRGAGEYTITVIVNDDCQSQTSTIVLAAPGLQELGNIEFDLDFSGLQPFGNARPLLMENDLLDAVNDGLDAGTVEHPAPAQPLTFDWLVYGKNAVRLSMPIGKAQELRVQASQFNIRGEGLSFLGEKLLDMQGNGFEVALNQRLSLAKGKAQPFIEGGFRAGTYQLQQGQINRQKPVNPHIHFPFWMMSFSSGLEWHPSENLELNVKKEWMGRDWFFIGLEMFYRMN